MDDMVRTNAFLARRCVMAGAAVLVVLGLTRSATAATYGEAMAWYGEAAEAGDAEAQYLLAFALETGARAAPDAEDARRWYGAAAGQGHQRAALRLALMLIEGRGGPVDTAEAEAVLQPVAEAGDVDAMSLLGWLLAHGGNDDTSAYRWLALATEAGDGAAAANLAILVNGMTPEQVVEAATALEAWRKEP